MNKSTLKRLPLAAALALTLLGGCAKEEILTTGEKARAYLNLVLEKNYPGVTPNEQGIYLLSDTPGSGDAWNEELPFTLAETTVRTLSGDVLSTTDATLSQQLGTYQSGNFYGPRFTQTGAGNSYAGVDALLRGMQTGGTRRAIIPAWLLTTSRYNSTQEYLNACSNETHLEYTVTLHGQEEDIVQYQKDQIKLFLASQYPGKDLQPTTYNPEQEADGTFYFISDSTDFIGKYKFQRDTTVRVNYTGYLLDGSVFDTTVERTAKDAGIYNRARSYGPVSVNVYSSYNSITMGSSSVINGFKGGIHLMHWVGQKSTVVFTAEHGYAGSGSGNSIPPYAPLVFELEIL